ncbi:MAG: Phosphoglycerate mutase, partial [Parcubacteria group bacterium GW2011_GWA2_42_14]
FIVRFQYVLYHSFILPPFLFGSYRCKHRGKVRMYPNVKEPHEDPRLDEADRGIWHTMTKEDIEKFMPWEIKRKNRVGLYRYRPFGGESWPQVELRIHSFLGTLARDYSGDRVLIVGHGNWFILFQRLIHHFSIKEAERRYHEAVLENTSITVYEEAAIGGKSRMVLNKKYDNFVPWKGLL